MRDLGSCRGSCQGSNLNRGQISRKISKLLAYERRLIHPRNQDKLKVHFSELGELGDGIWKTGEVGRRFNGPSEYNEIMKIEVRVVVTYNTRSSERSPMVGERVPCTSQQLREGLTSSHKMCECSSLEGLVLTKTILAIEKIL